MKSPAVNQSAGAGEAEKKNINTELWQACAGPLVNLPAAGTHVVYFPQGHSEQVAASMKKDVDAQIPNYSNLPSKLLCILHNVTLHADPETDEVYAQMTLQPVTSFDKEALLRSDITMRANKPQTEFFCKTLTASDTSTHGGFSVPRRAAEKIFPPLDFTMQPPAQELMARDLHDNVWTFRHIYRGQPKRHLLTTGWSLFVGGKRLFAGDSVLFIRDEKQQLLLGIRRANRQPANLSSSVLSSDSMHIGILAAAAHAAANNSPFTVFYNPRASPSEFVIPLAKYYKAVCSHQISLGMRFRMMFETEESGTRRYMGTITGISDLDPLRWKNSQWRNLQVGWDESSGGERRNRVSIWEIEPVTAPFFLCPTPPFFHSKRPRQPGMLDDDSSDMDTLFRRTMPWLGDTFGGLKDPQALSGMGLLPWMNMQQNPSLANPMQSNYMNPLSNSFLQNLAAGADISRQLGLPATQPNNNIQFNSPGPVQLDQLQKLPPIIQPQQQLNDISQQQRQKLSTSSVQFQNLHNTHVQAQNVLQTQQSHQFMRNFSQNLPSNQSHSQQQNQMVSDQHLNVSDNNQMQQLQLLQKLQQQQQVLLGQQQSAIHQQPSPQSRQIQNQPNQLSDFSTSIPTSQILDATLPMPILSSDSTKQMQNFHSQTNLPFSHQAKLQQTGILLELPGQMGNNNTNALTNQLSARGGGSTVTDEVPSCSTSPSTNNGSNAVMNSRNHRPSMMADEITQSSATLCELDFSSIGNLVKDVSPKVDNKPSVNMISKNQNQNQNQGGFPYLNPIGTQIDYLDSSSSATSVLSQNEAHIPQPYNSMSMNSQSLIFRDISQDAANIDNQLGMMSEPLITKDMVGSSKDFMTNHSSGRAGMLSGYENPATEAQHELSSSIVSQSFGVPDITFNSIDSTINDDGFGTWGPAQIPRMRTYTKVYKRGAVGRSIDITAYSGYDELKQDLARRFGIEGQLEDRQRVGWKLVYVDHENDVLLVGDDPWEEFVSCVRCIKILSPQEVQQMSLDGDFGNGSLQNQACSSSDNGVN